MNEEPTNPNPHDAHDIAEPDREGEDDDVETTQPPEYRYGAKLSVKVGGLEAEAWGANLPECRVHLLDLLLFVKTNFKPSSNGEYR